MAKRQSPRGKDNKVVVTPGGPRPRELVHEVKPREAVMHGPGVESQIVSMTEETERKTLMPEDIVITPGGARPRSLVHMIEPDHVLDGSEGRLRKLDPSRNVAADLGPIASRPVDIPLMPGNVTHPPTVVPGLPGGWIIYASWANNTGHPITSFRTTWVVPPPPATQSGQLIYLFNGIQNQSMIYQPVLQWGNNGAFGGNYWVVASWYADGQGGAANHSTPVQVNPGDVLVGVMTLTGQSGNQFSYTCVFQGIPNSNLTIQNVQQLTWCCETLEAYNLTQCSDYPNTDITPMTAINIQTSAGNPTVVWTAQDLQTSCGQHAQVVSNSPMNGEVDLYYHVSTQPAVAVPLYRYWNARGGDHFYTTNWSELGGGKYGWVYEGVQCYVHSQALMQTVPLYRYWNARGGDHFYTTNWRELGSGAYGWAFEGIQCYVHTQPVFGSVALYRYWNPQIADHFYTTNWNELGSGKYGWNFEGIQCYVHTQRVLTPETEGRAPAEVEDEVLPPTFTTSATGAGGSPPPTFSPGFGGSAATGAPETSIPDSFRRGDSADSGTVPGSFRVTGHDTGDQPAQKRITIIVE